MTRRPLVENENQKFFILVLFREIFGDPRMMVKTRGVARKTRLARHSCGLWPRFQNRFRSAAFDIGLRFSLAFADCRRGHKP